MARNVFINKGLIVGDVTSGIASTDELGLVKIDGDTVSISEDGTISSNYKTKILEINATISESALLNLLNANEGYECSGFFYNYNQGVYCEFEGLYSGHVISGETVHFGYCHIRGIHNSNYSIDYYIDDEDGSTWYAKTPGDYITNELGLISEQIMSKFNKGSVKSVHLLKRTGVAQHVTVKFKDYYRSALIFGNYGPNEAFMYIYGDGYCVPVKTASNITVSLPSAAQGWINFKLTTDGSNSGYLGVIDLGGNDVTITSD